MRRTVLGKARYCRSIPMSERGGLWKGNDEKKNKWGKEDMKAIGGKGRGRSKEEKEEEIDSEWNQLIHSSSLHLHFRNLGHMRDKGTKMEWNTVLIEKERRTPPPGKFRKERRRRVKRWDTVGRYFSEWNPRIPFFYQCEGGDHIRGTVFTNPPIHLENWRGKIYSQL